MMPQIQNQQILQDTLVQTKRRSLSRLKFQDFDQLRLQLTMDRRRIGNVPNPEIHFF